MGEKTGKQQLDASALRLAVVVSRYNEDISRRLLKGAFDTLREAGGEQIGRAHV